MGRRLNFIIKAPYQLLRWVLTGNTQQDWKRVVPEISIMALCLILALLAFDDRHHDWMDRLYEHIAVWPLLELLALIVTPIYMWWFDPYDEHGVSPVWRVVITIFCVFLVIAGGLYKILIAFPLFFLVFFTFRFVPVLLREGRPTTEDRKVEVTKFALVLFYLFFILGPVALVFSIFAGKLDFDYYFYALYFAVSASYFFVVASLGLKARTIRRVIVEHG